MTITINEINSSTALRVGGVIYLVQEYHHVKPGKGSAFVRVKFRNLETDAVLERTFRSSDKLDDVNLDEKDLEFLYSSGDDYYFMDHTTYEQVLITKEHLGDVRLFLKENLEVRGTFLGPQLLKITLPTFIQFQIAETEPGIRGDSSRAGTKPAKIETGAMIQVPLFVNTSDWVKIDTRSGSYVERVLK